MSPFPSPPTLRSPADDHAPDAPPARRIRRALRARRVAAGLAVLTVAGGAVLVTGRGGSASGGYRTATVATQSVDQVLDRVATVEPVTQASVAFPTAGTVATVDVAVGDRVEVGQQLASLDAESLEAARTEAQATLDQARLTLERALAGEDVGGGLDGAAPSGESAASGVAPASATGDAVITNALWTGGSDPEVVPSATTTASATTDDTELSAAQQAVLDAQAQVDTDLALAQQALDDATTTCATVDQPAPESAETTTTEAAGDDGTANTLTACRDALNAVLAAQQVVDADQDALVTASDALDTLLDERAEQPTESPGTTTTTTPPTTSTTEQSPGGGSNGGGTPPASTGSGGTTGGGTTGAAPPGGDGSGAGPSGQASPGAGDGQGAAGGATTSSPSAAELVAYQRDVDAAEDQLAVAEQAVAQATIVSPIAGTVQAVGLAAGDEVTAGSTTATVTVVGDGGYEVTTTVTVDDLPDVEIGQAATVTPDGGEPLDGEVVSIGVTGTTGDSATTYPITIGLTGEAGEADVRNGTTASVGIVTGSTEDALAVPTSAVTIEGGNATVTVLNGGTPTDVRVEVGVVGGTWTEVTDGLSDGDEVVLADLDAALPGSATDGSSATTGFRGPGGGGFGGPPSGG